MASEDVDCDLTQDLVLAQREIVLLQAELADLRSRSKQRDADLPDQLSDLDEFAHVAAHDLKAPIRSVRGFTEMALEVLPSDSPAREQLGHVIDAARRMTDIVERLLDFALTEDTDPVVDEIDLSAIVRDIEMDLQREIGATDAQIVTIGNLAAVAGSAGGIRQVLSNLIGNAIRYRSTVARPVIELSTISDDDGVTLVVSDNGIGFDQKHAVKMFEPFQRLHPTSVSGSGIGLAICKRIVQRHRGRIWATSSPGEGSIFEVWLPNHRKPQNDPQFHASPID